MTRFNRWLEEISFNVDIWVSEKGFGCFLFVCASVLACSALVKCI